MKDKPRIGTDNESRRIEIYNGDYSPSGMRLGHFLEPWTVLTPHDATTHATHAQAIQHAFKEAEQQ